MSHGWPADWACREGCRNQPVSDQEPGCDGRWRCRLDGSFQGCEAARQLRDYGEDRRYEHVELGLNSRLDELHAAILRSALLPRLTTWIERRRQIADLYLSSLTDTGLRPIVAGHGHSANHLFPVEVIGQDPGDVAERLAEAGISAGRHYPFVCPDQPAAKGRGEALDQLVTARRWRGRSCRCPSTHT